jgi:hypothetical protein
VLGGGERSVVRKIEIHPGAFAPLAFRPNTASIPYAGPFFAFGSTWSRTLPRVGPLHVDTRPGRCRETQNQLHMKAKDEDG